MGVDGGRVLLRWKIRKQRRHGTTFNGRYEYGESNRKGKRKCKMWKLGDIYVIRAQVLTSLYLCESEKVNSESKLAVGMATTGLSWHQEICAG